jgi:hypothetical protein
VGCFRLGLVQGGSVSLGPLDFKEHNQLLATAAELKSRTEIRIALEVYSADGSTNAVQLQLKSSIPETHHPSLHLHQTQTFHRDLSVWQRPSGRPFWQDVRLP